MAARLAAGSLDGSVEGWEEYYDPEKNPRLDPEQVYVAEEDGYIRAMRAVLPMEVFVDEEPILIEGIADAVIHLAYLEMQEHLYGLRFYLILVAVLWPVGDPQS